MISFIVSLLDRTPFLNACLASLAVQDGPNQIVVCSNTLDQDVMTDHIKMTEKYGGECLLTGTWGAKSCYRSANLVHPEIIKGDWVCFPSDDSLYVCKFSEIMLRTAVEKKADLVYCDCVYRKGETANPQWKDYTVLSTEPRMGKIDKTCFILRRELFNGFPQHPKGWCDGALIEQLVRDGVRHAKAPGILVVHQ